MWCGSAEYLCNTRQGAGLYFDYCLKDLIIIHSSYSDLVIKITNEFWKKDDFKMDISLTWKPFQPLSEPPHWSQMSFKVIMWNSPFHFIHNHNHLIEVTCIHSHILLITLVRNIVVFNSQICVPSKTVIH
jgi:hypothetical protein